MQFPFIMWQVSVRIDHISIFSDKTTALPWYDQRLECKDCDCLIINHLKTWGLAIFHGALQETNFSSKIKLVGD